MLASKDLSNLADTNKVAGGESRTISPATIDDSAPSDKTKINKIGDGSSVLSTTSCFLPAFCLTFAVT